MDYCNEIISILIKLFAVFVVVYLIPKFREFLNNKIGYVSQKAVMFSGSVASNVTYGDNGKGKVSEEKIKQFAEFNDGENCKKLCDYLLGGEK